MYFIIAQFACDDNPKSQPDSSAEAARSTPTARFAPGTAHPKAGAWFRRRAQSKSRHMVQAPRATKSRHMVQAPRATKADASSRTSRRIFETSEPRLRPQRREICPSVCIFNPVKPDQVAGVHPAHGSGAAHIQKPPHGSGAARNQKPAQAPGRRAAHPKRPNRVYARSGESFVLPFAYSTR